MDIKEAREENKRARLRIWFEDRTVPREKSSQISQLMGAKVTFGDTAARSIERFFGMPENYLDKKVTKKDIAGSMLMLRLYNARTLVVEAGGIERFAMMVDIDIELAERLAGRGASQRINLDYAELIEDAFKRPRGWLSEVHSIKLDGETDSSENLELSEVSATSQKNVQLCRLIIATGTDGEVTIEEAHNEGSVPFLTRSSKAYAARFRGDGGAPRVCSGDVVIIEPDVQAIPGDTVIVILKSSKKFIKKLLYARDDETYVSSIDNIGQSTFQSADILEVHRFAGFIPYGSLDLRDTKASEANRSERILKTAS